MQSKTALERAAIFQTSDFRLQTSDFYLTVTVTSFDATSIPSSA